MMWVYIQCILLLVVTCVFLVYKLGYFIDTGISALLLPMNECYLAWEILILIFCSEFLGYVLVLFVITLIMFSFFVLFTDFPIGV
jgi:hypothetical protein